MVWFEVETKIRLKNSEVSEMRRRIKRIARFEKKGKKADDYFAIHRNGYPKKAFRIRATRNNFEVNFKKWLKHLWTREIVVKQEFEFRLKGREQVKDLLELFEDFGFREWMRKIKRNETYRYKKNKRVGIEINFVKHLGYFIEIEYLAKRDEIDKAKKVIMKILNELKIEPKQIDNTGYTKMLWDKGTKEKKGFIDI